MDDCEPEQIIFRTAMLFSKHIFSYKRTRVIFLLAGFSLLSGNILRAQQNNSTQTYAFSLKQAIDYAIQNKPAVKNALLDETIAQKKVNEITGIGLPQLNGSLEFNDFLKLPTSFLPDFISPSIYGVLAKEQLIDPGKVPTGEPALFPVQFGTKYTASAGLTLSQLIFDGSYIVGLKASKTYVDLSRRNTQRTKIETATQVTKAYYTVIVNERRLNLIDANVTRLTKIFSDTKALNEQGFVEKLDVDRLSVTLNSLEIEKQKLQNFIELSRYLLKFQMGMPVDAQLTLTDSISESNFAALTDDKNDYTKRVEYGLLQTQKKLYTLDMQRHKSTYLPSVAAFGSVSTQAQRNEFNFFDSDEKWFQTAVIGGKVSIPIFDGLQKRARIQQSRLNIQKTDNDILNLESAIALDIANSRLMYENATKTLETQRKNMELAQEIVRVTNIKYTEGVGSNLEVVNAEASLKESQTNYFNALYDVIISQVELSRARGTLY
ncbi:MAG: TolC family protein [Sphingobacteriales bacterium]|nr:MAG: TolC family protein [Sphingobacteriales bacterium]